MDPNDHGLFLDPQSLLEQAIPLQEVHRIVVSLLTEVGHEVRSSRQQDTHHAPQIPPGQPDARIRPVDIQLQQMGILVPWAYITLPAEGTHGHRVLVQQGQIVGKGTVHVANSSHLTRYR